jgi:FkbM family methyltransferase
MALDPRWSRTRIALYKVLVKTKIFLLEGILRPVRPAGMVRFGTYYGGWWIPEVAPERGAAFCVGAGTDVSFDLELQRLGYRVYTVDPTPTAVEHVSSHAPSLELVPVGVWQDSGDLEFANDACWGQSWAITDNASAVTGTGEVRRFPVVTMQELLARTHEADPAILKLDVEGAEHVVLESMLRDGIRPHSICVEFDDHRVREVLRTTRRLRRAGYDLLQIEGLNYLFVRR